MKKLLLSMVAIAIVGLTACAQKKAQAANRGKKVLVAYVSMTGNTARAAQALAAVTGGELYEIAPEKPYTADDLDWSNEQSRCYVEMHDLAFRPALKGRKDDIADYDVIYLGYPIWWNLAPTLVNSFVEAHDLKGKTVVPFATSGGSTIENSVAELKSAYPGIRWKEGRLLNGASEDDIRRWLDE